VLWAVTPFGLVYEYQYFEGTALSEHSIQNSVSTVTNLYGSNDRQITTLAVHQLVGLFQKT